MHVCYPTYECAFPMWSYRRMMLCGYRGLGRQEQAAIELNSVQLENFFGVRLKWRQHRLGLGHGEHYQASIQHLFDGIGMYMDVLSRLQCQIKELLQAVG